MCLQWLHDLRYLAHVANTSTCLRPEGLSETYRPQDEPNESSTTSLRDPSAAALDRSVPLPSPQLHSRYCRTVTRDEIKYGEGLRPKAAPLHQGQGPDPSSGTGLLERLEARAKLRMRPKRAVFLLRSASLNFASESRCPLSRVHAGGPLGFPPTAAGDTFAGVPWRRRF